MNKKTITTPRLAATSLLIRDSELGIETFMVIRNAGMAFMGGAMVFPGGSVDDADYAPALLNHCRTDTEFDKREQALRVACIRETFEEAGVLLAHEVGEPNFISAERSHALYQRYAGELVSGALTIAEMVQNESLELNLDALVKFAHWITPEHRSTRFDTHFYIAQAPADQQAAHDGEESVDSTWTTAHQAFDDHRNRRRLVIFPTQCNLEKINRSSNVSDALALARQSEVVTVMPIFIDGKRQPFPEGSDVIHQEVMPLPE